MKTRFGSTIIVVAFACLIVGVLAAASFAQPSGGAMLAGQASPWRNAHFVLYAYGAMWVGLALYLWHLASVARRLNRDIADLEHTVEAKARAKESATR